MRTRNEGLLFIPKILAIDPDISIVMCSLKTDFETVREAMRLGASDFLAKNASREELIYTLSQTIERRTLLQRHSQQTFESLTLQRRHVIIGSGPGVSSLRSKIEKVRNASSNVIITGETGTGKELVARQLRKTLADGSLTPFLAIDSSTIQSSTAESILFGHERGAFTGAEKMTKGLFEEANGGIVYFDEISNMPLNIQSKLLRVIQEKEITRLGSSKVITLDFRVVCATNKDLEHLVKLGEFKDDLLQRLNVIPVQIPTLRETQRGYPRAR